MGMVASGGVSTQANKFDRGLITMDHHKIKIDPTSNKAKDRNALLQFKAAVVEPLGFSVDKRELSDAAKFFDDLLNGTNKNSATILSAVDIIKNIINTQDVDTAQAIARDSSLSQADSATLLEAIAIGGEKAHTLNALVALAKYTPDKAFNTSITREVDGITNGVAIGLLQLAAAKDWAGMRDLMSASGVFSNIADATYGKWKNNSGHKDNYEQIAAVMVPLKNTFLSNLQNNKITDIVQEFIDANGTVESAKALDSFSNPLEIDGVIQKEARNLVKYPLMTTSYGSAMMTVMNNVSLYIMDQTYNAIEDLATYPDALPEVKAQIESIVGPIDLTLSNYQQFKFNNRQKQQFLDQANAYYGDAMRQAIEKNFSSFMDRRTEVNNALNTIYSIFEYKYNNQVNAESKAQGSPISNERRQAISLELAEFMPAFKHYLSSDDVTTELMVANEKATGVYDDDNYKATTYFNRGSESTSLPQNMTTRGTIPQWVPPGVGGFIKAIHSTDFGIMSEAIDGFTVGNVHDAILVNLYDVQDASMALNKGFKNVSTEYNIRAAVGDSLARVLSKASPDEIAHANSRLNAVNKIEDNKTNPLFLDYSLSDFDTDSGTRIPKYKDVQQLQTRYNSETENTLSKTKEWFDKNITHIVQYNDGSGGLNIEQNKLLEYDEDTRDNEMEAYVKDLAKVANDTFLTAEQKKTLRSAPNQLDENTFNPSREQSLNSSTAVSIFHGLDSDSTPGKRENDQHKEYLKNELESVSTKVLEPLWFR